MPWNQADLAPLFTPAGLMPLAGELSSGTSREYIPGGTAGTAATIYRMQQLVEMGRRDPCVKNVVGEAIQHCRQKDFACYARAIYEWVLRNVRYVYDPNDVEEIEHPCYTLTQSRVGDCDSLAVAIASLYERIDLPARFVTVKADLTTPNDYSHVFVEVNVPGKGWMGADTTMPTKYFGWVPPKRFPRREWPATLSRKSGPREDKLEGFRVGRDAMYVSSGCMGHLGYDYSNPFAPGYTPYQTPVVDAPVEVLEKFPGLVSAQSASDQAVIASRIEQAKTNRMLIWGGVGLAAALLYFGRKR